MPEPVRNTWVSALPRSDGPADLTHGGRHVGDFVWESCLLGRSPSPPEYQRNLSDIRSIIARQQTLVKNFCLETGPKLGPNRIGNR